ncbi:high mobility group box domain-containing protein, partial [Trametes punicea]
PRPRNAWMIYRSEKWKALLGRQPSGTVLKQADISRIIAEDWANEPEAVRVEYERKARAVKEEHARMYPDYKYTP